MEIKKSVDSDGIVRYYDKESNVLHREDGPAVEYPNGGEEWYQYGKRHREGGPALVMHYGEKHWFKQGKHHREGGPAIIYAGGDQYWCKDGVNHRLDGPAVVTASGYKEWHINGEHLTKDEFDATIDALLETLSSQGMEVVL